jgi:hypothetical protein
MFLRTALAGVLMLAALPHSLSAASVPVGHVTGLGGVFVKSKDPKALAAWYRDMLGIKLEPWGGAVLRYDAPLHPPAVAWTALPATSKYMARLHAISCWISGSIISTPLLRGLHPTV